MSTPYDASLRDAFPESYLTTAVSDRLMQGILDAFNHEQLTPHQARQVLSRVRELIDLGELIARTGSH